MHRAWQPWLSQPCQRVRRQWFPWQGLVQPPQPATGCWAATCGGARWIFSAVRIVPMRSGLCLSTSMHSTASSTLSSPVQFGCSDATLLREDNEMTESLSTMSDMGCIAEPLPEQITKHKDHTWRLYTYHSRFIVPIIYHPFPHITSFGVT